MAFYAPITGTPARASDDVRGAVPNRRDLLVVLAGAGVAAQAAAASMPPMAPPLRGGVTRFPERSAVQDAAEAVRAHSRAYDEAHEDEWIMRDDRLQQAFACTPARDLQELAKKMSFALEPDLLADYARHNSMVHVMAQLQIWARSPEKFRINGCDR